MDSKGRVTDNIAIERFWRSEHIYLSEYQSERFHQSLKYQKPMEVYQKIAA